MLVRSPSRSRFASPRLLAPLLAAGSLLYAAMAPALGLGDITLRSSLNQPFRADIELLDTAGLQEGDITATLASAEEFARAGVERGFFLNDLKFTPDLRGTRKVIRVVSSKAVTEPYMSFLVQVGRPNGQLLRTFTVLLDPPGLGPGLSDRAPQSGNSTATVTALPTAAAAAPAPATPAAPLPAAGQGKRYEVARGDNLWSIGKRLEQVGTPVSVNQLVRQIRALNPGNTPLKAGQSLLLPDAAVLPDQSESTPETTPAAAPTPAPTSPSNTEQEAEQITATVLENQQLQKNFDDLQARLQSLETQVADKDKQVSELQARLSEAPAPALPAVAPVPAPTPAASAAPAATVPAAPVSATPAASGDQSQWLNILAVLAVLLLVIALLLLMRRQRQRKALPSTDALAPVIVRPAQPSLATAAVAPAPLVTEHHDDGPRVEPVVARKEAPPATDALDGASIYIAYGRFNEALGILREGLVKAPERTDLRLRMLEVLGQQGNAKGFAEQEALLLATGVSAATVLQVRNRYPLMAPAAEPERREEAAPAPAFEPELDVEPALVREAQLEPQPDLQSEPVTPTSPASESVTQRPSEDLHANEFQLNLDDLSMDADWELVSPFDRASPPKVKPGSSDIELSESTEVDFDSNLKEFPEVFEMPDEQFLSDFAELEDETFELEDETLTEREPTPAKTQDDIDNDFLDSFIAGADLPELDALTVDFDDLESQHASAEKLELAQQRLEEGDVSAASHLLHELLREGDESCKQAARQLLSRLG